MSKIFRISEKIGDYADKAVYVIGGLGLLICAGMCGANILLWWFAGKRIAVCDEISLVGLIWATYIGMGILFRNNGHCTMDFVVKAMPPKAQTIIRIITDIAIVVVAVIVVRYSWALAVKSLNKRLILTKIPYFYVDISVTIGYAHLLLLAAADVAKNIYKLTVWGKEEKE